MKKISFAIGIMLLLGATACSTNKTNDSQQTEMKTAASKLVSSLKATQESYSLNDTISLEFTVTNPTKETIRFTQYHTPFEGMMSKFLDVTDSNGNEMNYIGAMAKRMMPPPESSYHTLQPGESKSVKFSLKKGYEILKPGVYKINYNQVSINEIKGSKTLKITVTE
jgi:hypothetical protein